VSVYCTCEDSVVFIAWWVVTALVRTVLSSLLGECLLHLWGQCCLRCLASVYCTCENSVVFIAWWLVTALVRTVLSSLLGECLLHLWGQFCLHCLVTGYWTCEDIVVFIINIKTALTLKAKTLQSFETSRNLKSPWPVGRFGDPLAGNRVTFLVIPACSVDTVLTKLSCSLSTLDTSQWYYSKCSILGVVRAWRQMLRASADRERVSLTV